MSNKPIYVAIADDHSILRSALAELIPTFGDYEVIIEADNGKDLLDKIADSWIVPEICILDVGMPVLNGYDTLKIMKEKWPYIKVLILSMYTDEYAVINLLKAGANGYLFKNSDPKELEIALASISSDDYYHPELSMNAIDYLKKEPKRKSMVPVLSERETQFMKWCCSDLHYEAIAEKMNVNSRTVEGYRDKLFEKLGVETRTGLVMYALRIGIVPPTGNSDFNLEGMK